MASTDEVATWTALAAIAIVLVLVWLNLKRARDANAPSLGSSVDARLSDLTAQLINFRTEQAATTARIESEVGSVKLSAADLGRTTASHSSQLAEVRAGIVQVVEARSHEVQQQVSLAKQQLEQLQAGHKERSDEIGRRIEALQRAQETTQAILTGYGKGQAGENLLQTVLAQLPPDLLLRNVALTSGEVEFALRVLGDKLLPIDSKMVATEEIAAFEDSTDEGRERLAKSVGAKVEGRVAEVAKYLTDPRSERPAVLAVSPAIYRLSLGSLTKAYDRGVLILPYDLVLPYALTYLRLYQKFAPEVDIERLRSAAATVLGRVSIIEKLVTTSPKGMGSIPNVLSALDTILNRIGVEARSAQIALAGALGTSGTPEGSPGATKSREDSSLRSEPAGLAVPPEGFEGSGS